MARCFGGRPDEYLDAPGAAATAEWIESLKAANDPVATYAEHVQWAITKAGAAAHRYRRWASVTTAAVVVATFAAAVLAAITSVTATAALAVVAAALSALVGALTTWGKSSRWSALATANHTLAVGLDFELTHFQFGAGPYRPEHGGRDPRALIERCEALSYKVQLEEER